MSMRSKSPPDASLEDMSGDPTVKKRMVTIDPKDLIGRTFLKDTEEDGQCFHARHVRAVIEKEDQLTKGSEYMKSICNVPGSTVHEIFTYNEILDHIKRDNSDLV
jgi:hypothetical protein